MYPPPWRAANARRVVRLRPPGYRRPMSDEEPGDGRGSSVGPGVPEDDEPASTPFDKPYFLPLLLWAFAIWFGYDAFINQDEHMQDSFTLWFNRIGFPIVGLLALYFTFKAVKEMKEPGPGGDSSSGQ